MVDFLYSLKPIPDGSEGQATIPSVAMIQLLTQLRRHAPTPPPIVVPLHTDGHFNAVKLPQLQTPEDEEKLSTKK